MNAAMPVRVTDAMRARAVFILCGLIAMGLGVFTAVGSQASLIAVSVTLIFFVAAFLLPLPLVALTLAALIPLQIYFPFAGALSMRGALVFVVAATVRVLGAQSWRAMLKRLRVLTWLAPAVLFMLAALAAVPTAVNHYSALKGLYDWLPIFATALVIGEIVRTERLRAQMIAVLIVAGVGEAILGALEAAASLPNVIAALQLPVSEIFFQPNLLHEKLFDVSFNWVLDNRVLPFGTFINDIDFAIFVAAVTVLVVGLLLGRRKSQFEAKPQLAMASLSFVILFGSAGFLGAVLLQTLKGSGAIALAGGMIALGSIYLPRLSSRTLVVGGLVLIIAAVIAVPFSDAIVQRVVFLVQREAGALSATGRTAIWLHLLANVPQRPWFGFGLNNALFLVPILPSLNGGAFVFNLPTAESAYVAALVETGIVGCVGLLGFIAVVLGRAYRNARTATMPAREAGIFAALVAVFCGSLTVVGLTTDQNGLLLGVLIGLVFARVNQVDASTERL